MALIKTTTIGAWPKPAYVTVPDWFTNPDTPDPTAGWAEAVAALGDDASAVFQRGVAEAIDDQVLAGIDVPTDGEIRRENYIHYHCRHLDGFDFDGLSERAVRSGNYVARLPTIRGRISLNVPVLVDEWTSAQQCTDRPVKITLPGPLTIYDTTVDAFYGDAESAGRDLADALNRDVVALAEAGCRHIQIDEPVFARQPDNALGYGLDNLERVFHGCPATVTRTVHMCCGYPDRLDNPDYPKADRQAYQRLAPAIDASSIDAVSIEDAHRNNDLSLLELLANTQVVFGVVAVARSSIESVDDVQDRLRAALQHIDKDRLWAAPDCGLGLLGRDLARAKIDVMCRAVAQIG